MTNYIDINKNTILSSLMWKMLEKFSTQGCSLIIQIILARLLLPSDFGNLAIILAIVNFLSVFVQSGLSAAIIQKRDLSQLDINTLFSISLSVAGVIYFALYFLVPYFSDYYEKPELILPIRVTALILFLYSFNSIQVGILSRQMNFKAVFVRQSMAVLLAGLISIILACLDFGLWALILYNFLNILFVVVFLLIGTNIKFRFQISRESACSLYSFCVKIMGANMISGLGDLFRTMIIGKKYSTSELAYYDRAYNYSLLVLQIVNNSIQSILLPVFARKQDNLVQLKETSRKSTQLSLFVLTPFLFGMIVIAKPLVLLLLTEKWLPCVPYFMLFLLFRLAGSIVGIDKQVYMALGKSSILLYFEFFLLIANVIMLLITVPIGIKAIAIGALVVEYLSSFVLILISQRVYSYTLRERFKDLIRPIITSIVMMGTMWGVSLSTLNGLLLILIQVVVGFVVYLFLCYKFKDNSFLYLSGIVKDICCKYQNFVSKY